MSGNFLVDTGYDYDYGHEWQTFLSNVYIYMIVKYEGGEEQP